MEQHEIETLRDKVPCAAVLEREGWTVDVKESTTRAVKYRRGAGEIIIVIHNGRGWFDPLSDAKGDVFTLADIAVYPHVAQFAALGLPVPREVESWLARVAARPSVRSIEADLFPLAVMGPEPGRWG